MTKSNQTIQQKMDKLRELMAWFDSDDFSLEDAQDMFRKAHTLSQEIEHDLRTVKNEITVLKESFEKKRG